MKIATTICFVALSGCCLPAAAATEQTAAEPSLESLVTCKESWLDWKENPARGEKFGASLHAGYTVQKDGGYLVPKAKTTLFGLTVTQVYPESVGMGVGFSVAVAGNFEASKKAVEKAVGKPLKCEADSDEVHACQAELGPKKTVMVASNSADSKSILIGCYYFYEK